MKKNIRVLSVAMLASTFFLAMCAGKKEKKTEKKEVTQKERIVSLKGAFTEVLCAMVKCDELVGTDVTSVYPEQAAKTEKLGHVRGVTAEGVLSLSPTMVLLDTTEVKAEVVKALRKAEIKLVSFKQEYSVQGTKDLLDYFSVQLKADEAKVSELKRTIDEKVSTLSFPEQKPKVLFIYARGANQIMVAGNNTQMKSFIELSGGENAVNDFDGFKPLTPESLIEINPDYILMFESGAKSLQDEAGILQLSGMDQTNAGKNKALIQMEGALISGFGPRLGEALKSFNEKMNL